MLLCRYILINRIKSVDSNINHISSSNLKIIVVINIVISLKNHECMYYLWKIWVSCYFEIHLTFQSTLVSSISTLFSKCAQKVYHIHKKLNKNLTFLTAGASFFTSKSLKNAKIWLTIQTAFFSWRTCCIIRLRMRRAVNKAGTNVFPRIWYNWNSTVAQSDRSNMLFLHL